jgi:dynein heavy chain
LIFKYELLKREALDTPEDAVLMRALRDMNMPKFVYEDVPLFMGLIQDLFPGLDSKRVPFPKRDKINEFVEKEGLRSMAD